MTPNFERYDRTSIFERYEPQQLPFLPGNRFLGFRSELQAQTGFSSYKSFLEALEETGPHFKELLRGLDEDRNKDRFAFGRPDLGEVVVLDILNDGSISVSWKVQRSGDPVTITTGRHMWPSYSDRLATYFDIDHKLRTGLFHNLQSPPKNIPARIVLWSIPWECDPYPGIIDALGLGLKIDPSFFEALLSITRPSYNSLRPKGSNHVKIGNSVATVARNYQSQGDGPPVLFVAGNFDDRIGIAPDKWEQRYRDMVDEDLKREIGGSVSFSRLAIETRSSVDLASMSSNQYLNLLSNHFQKDYNTDPEDDGLLLSAMLPLLKLEILRLCVQCQILQTALLEVQDGMEFRDRYPEDEKQIAYDSLDKQRFWLRRRLEDLEESRNRFAKYVRSQGAAKWLQSKTWLSQDEDISEIVIEARAKEVEARDYMQLQIGNLSILESRKSIQLSNQQIDKAKRGKKFDRSNWSMVC